MKCERLPIERIYVPVKRKGHVDPDRVRQIAESILEIGQQTPILVRPDGERFVLVEGLQRLEACKVLGEEAIVASLVQARSGSDAPSHEIEADAVRLKTLHLRQLRLAKEAEENLSATSVKAVATAASTRPHPVSGRSKSTSLLDWLAEKDTDGFRS